MYPMRPPNGCRASGGPSFSIGLEKNAKIDFFTASRAVGWNDAFKKYCVMRSKH